jgi:hypothetical protein
VCVWQLRGVANRDVCVCVCVCVCRDKTCVSGQLQPADMYPASRCTDRNSADGLRLRPRVSMLPADRPHALPADRPHALPADRPHALPADRPYTHAPASVENLGFRMQPEGDGHASCAQHTHQIRVLALSGRGTGQQAMSTRVQQQAMSSRVQQALHIPGVRPQN